MRIFPLPLFVYLRQIGNKNQYRAFPPTLREVFTNSTRLAWNNNMAAITSCKNEDPRKNYTYKQNAANHDKAMKWRLSISPQECIFNKKSDKTALRVFWNGDFRVYNCYRCCSRWYFTFNGAECSTPSAIDGIFIVWNDKNFVGNPHRPRHIEGICEKLRKGPVRVGFWVGKCVGTGYTGGDAATGFHSVSRIYVEEVSPPQA